LQTSSNEAFMTWMTLQSCTVICIISLTNTNQTYSSFFLYLLHINGSKYAQTQVKLWYFKR